VQIGREEAHVVKTMPRGISAEAARPHADYVRLKQILAARPLPISSFLDAAATERAVEAVAALQHLYAFIDEALVRFG